MDNLLDANLDILPEEQKLLWPKLGVFTNYKMVLYGGTAIALHLGHRTSIDFDFFTDQILIKDEILEQLGSWGEARIIVDRPRSLNVLVTPDTLTNKYVKFSFFSEIKFGRFSMPQIASDNKLQLASLDDLMATKLKVIMQRSELKDYFDIIAMLENGVDLSHCLAIAKAMFGNNFQVSECLKALCYFEDGDLYKLTAQNRKFLCHMVKLVKKLPHVSLLSTHLTMSNGNFLNPA